MIENANYLTISEVYEEVRLAWRERVIWEVETELSLKEYLLSLKESEGLNYLNIDEKCLEKFS